MLYIQNNNYPNMIKTPVSFRSKINFISKDEFYDKANVIRNNCGTGETFIARSSMVMGASSCMAGGIQNGKDVVMFHDTQPYDCIGYEIMSNINNIEAKKPVISAFLVGGVNDQFLQPAYKVLKGMFKDLNTKVTTFWGHKGDAYNTNLVYSNDNGEDTWFVNTLDFRYEDAIHSVKDLKNAFEVIDVLPEDEIYINGKKVDKKELMDD